MVGSASVMPYPALVVGVHESLDHGTLPVVIFEKSRDGMSVARSVVHAVTLP
jgi:hypothetical protein